MSWVLSDSERNRRFNKRNKFKGNRDSTEEVKKNISCCPLLGRKVEITMAIEEWSLIEKIHSYTRYGGKKHKEVLLF